MTIRKYGSRQSSRTRSVGNCMPRATTCVACCSLDFTGAICSRMPLNSPQEVVWVTDVLNIVRQELYDLQISPRSDVRFRWNEQDDVFPDNHIQLRIAIIGNSDMLLWRAYQDAPPGCTRHDCQRLLGVLDSAVLMLSVMNLSQEIKLYRICQMYCQHSDSGA
jgi:hypothetical protein